MSVARNADSESILGASTEAPDEPSEAASSHARRPLGALALAAIGIVFGDIGTSPLYTLAAVFDSSNGLPVEPANVIGVVSLILWSLLIVVSLKYVTLIMRASNHGEGGIIALLAMAADAVAERPQLKRLLLIVGCFGAALFYGDGVITPAISVLSAIEGMEVAAPHLAHWVLPIAVSVLVVLFLVQRHGTAGIGKVFGPIMTLWFLVIAIVGAHEIAAAPRILLAFNPLEGLDLLLHQGWIAFLALGAVVLSLTGAEALYADMGHFGPLPIRLSWFGLVFPALGLAYLGQGALLLSDPSAASSPFYNLFPRVALIPMILLATAATVIASQAVISGAFSMTRQAMQLGFLPRMTIRHTSAEEIGQIYVPAVNWSLFVAVIAAVIGFESSSGLAAAYGIAVTGTMLITAFLTFFVIRYAWHLPLLACVLATGFFFAIDATFFAANMPKFMAGGWFPLLLALTMFTVMTTWKRGREIMVQESRSRADFVTLRQYLDKLFVAPPMRTRGTAVFLSIAPDTVPHALVNNIAHNGVIHEQAVFVHVATASVPYIPRRERVSIESFGHGCYQVVVRYGFKDPVNLPRTLLGCASQGLAIDPDRVSYFLSHAIVVPTPGTGMWLWREHLFATMSQNLGNLAGYLNLKADRVIELGARVEI